MRKITELIWHCSATPEGRKVTVATIRKWHKSPPNNWSDIGYHKVVYLDGSIHDGRPMSKQGAHVKSRNKGTLGYCYIGGYAKDGKTVKDTRTKEQKLAMARLTREAITVYGVTKVSGHNQYSNKGCPSFNVPTDPTIQAAIRRAASAKPIVVSPAPRKPLPRKGPQKGNTKVTAVILAIAAAIFAFILKQIGVF